MDHHPSIPIRRRVKLLLVGSRRSGKTALAVRFLFGVYIGDETFNFNIDVVGVVTRCVSFGNGKVDVHILDPNDLDTPKSLSESHIASADAVLIVSNCFHVRDLLGARDWHRRLKFDLDCRVPIFLVAAKFDRSAVCTIEVVNFAHDLHVEALFTSALTGEGVQYALDRILETILEEDSSPKEETVEWNTRLAVWFFVRMCAFYWRRCCMRRS